MQRRSTLPALMTQCGVVAAALVVYHLVLRLLMTDYGLRLGAISYKLAPLYAYWRPHLKGWLAIPIAVLGLYLWFLRRSRVATSLTDRMAEVMFSLFAVAIAASVAVLDGGPRAVIAPLLRTDLEYYGAVDRVTDVTDFVRDYAPRAATMPMHAQVHPPGAVLFVWATCKAFGNGPWAAAAGIILFTALTVCVVYRWANRLGGPGVARRAAAIFALTPSIVLFTATSMDGPFAVFLTATMWLYWEALDASSPVRNAKQTVALAMLSGLLGGVAAFMTYSVAVTLLFCGIATCLWWITVPRRRVMTSLAAVSALAAFVTVHLLLWLVTGFDAIEMFRVAVQNSNHIMSGTRHETPARHLHIAVGNLVVFFIAAGLPCAVLWWRTICNQAARVVRTAARGQRPTVDARSVITDCSIHHSAHAVPPSLRETDPSCESSRTTRLRNFLATALLTLLIAATVPVYVLEVERVWMFLIPLVTIPVAGRLFQMDRHGGHVGATLAVIALLAIQTLVTEILLTTYW